MSGGRRGKRKSRASAGGAKRTRAQEEAPAVDSEADTSDDDALQAPPMPKTGGSLSWRTDPVEGLSDWTIKIVYESKGQDGVVISKTDTYHVHKCILGAGSRKSGYFARLFSDGGRFAENQGAKSRIEFHEIGIASEWESTTLVERADLMENLRKQSALVLSELLVRTISSALRYL